MSLYSSSITSTFNKHVLTINTGRSIHTFRFSGMYIDFRHLSTFLIGSRTFSRCRSIRWSTLCFFIKFDHNSRIYSVLSFQKPLTSLSFLSLFKRSLSFLIVLYLISLFMAKLKAKADFSRSLLAPHEIKQNLWLNLLPSLGAHECKLTVAWVVAWLIFTSWGCLVYNICNDSSLTLLSESKFIFSKRKNINDCFSANIAWL